MEPLAETLADAQHDDVPAVMREPGNAMEDDDVAALRAEAMRAFGQYAIDDGQDFSKVRHWGKRLNR